MLSILLGTAAHLHEPGGDHPETPERLDRLLKSVSDAGYLIRPCARVATPGELTMVHELTYVDHVLMTNGARVALDHETWLGPGSVQAALNAVGTALELSNEILVGNDRQIFAIVRPPGHHARPDAASGYCVFNNIAIAAEFLRRQGLRVCILDWDVHHGDGTERIFFGCPDVLFVSIHSAGLFPEGTGAASTVGEGSGHGCTVNIPLPAGSTLAAYALATTAVILPAVRRFRPEIVLVSMGFDAHERDPHGNMLLKTDDFAYVGAAIRSAAAGSARGRVGIVLEGGYDVDVIGPSAVAVLRGLERDLAEMTVKGLTTEEERRLIDEVVRIHGLERS